MPARAGPHHAHPVGIDLPFASFLPGEPYGARRIVEHGRVTISGLAEAVFHDDASDAFSFSHSRNPLPHGWPAPHSRLPGRFTIAAPWPCQARAGRRWTVGMSFGSLPKAPGAPSGHKGRGSRTLAESNGCRRHGKKRLRAMHGRECGEQISSRKRYSSARQRPASRLAAPEDKESMGIVYCIDDSRPTDSNARREGGRDHSLPAQREFWRNVCFMIH